MSARANIPSETCFGIGLAHHTTSTHEFVRMHPPTRASGSAGKHMNGRARAVLACGASCVVLVDSAVFVCRLCHLRSGIKSFILFARHLCCAPARGCVCLCVCVCVCSNVPECASHSHWRVGLRCGVGYRASLPPATTATRNPIERRTILCVRIVWHHVPPGAPHVASDRR